MTMQGTWSTQTTFFKAAIYCSIFIASLILLFLGVYVFNFWSSGLSPEPAHWGAFGDYIGGLANPILTFLTFIALIFTIYIQNQQLAVSSHQLALSSEELRLTREELKRAATAQELSEKALRAQADAAARTVRLSSVNYLLDHYKEEIKKSRGNISRDGREHHHKMQVKVIALSGMLSRMYDDVMNEPQTKDDLPHGHQLHEIPE